MKVYTIRPGQRLVLTVGGRRVEVLDGILVVKTPRAAPIIRRGSRARVVDSPGPLCAGLAGQDVVVTWAESRASVHVRVPGLHMVYDGSGGVELTARDPRTTDPADVAYTCIVPLEVLRVRRGARWVTPRSYA